MKDEIQDKREKFATEKESNVEETLDIDTPESLEDPIQDDNEEKDEIEVTQNLNFNFVPYNESIVITGSQGSGKSYLANTLLQNLHGVNVFVWDFNHAFHDSRSVLVNHLDEMIEMFNEYKQGKFILQDFDKEEPQFRRFCKYAFSKGNCVVIIDEAHNYVTKQKILKEYNQLILSGRPRGISVISISTRPATLPNNVLTNAKHVVAFRLNIESDVKFLESWMGSEVWQLVAKNKRSKHQDMPEIPEHSFFYRNHDESIGQIGKV